MVLATVREKILDDLDRLTPEQQRRAAEMVHSLTSEPLKGTPGRDLARFFGAMDPESVREMSAAIEEGCERVDLNEW